jgi:hypothetical protein
MAQQAPMTQAQLIQQDAMLAAMLIQNSTEYYVKQSPVTASSLGQALNITLPNSGIMLSCDLQVQVAIDITSAATANPIGAAGVITNISTYDWYGNVRSNVSASRLQSLNAYRQGRPYNQVPTGFSEDTAGLLYSLPTSVGNATIDFEIHVPFAQGGGSLAGALLTQTSNGSCSINLQTISALVSATNPHAPYSAGTITVSGVTITPTFRYLMPVSFAGNTLPLLSLSTAYSIQEIRSPENLSVGAQNFTNFPAARTVYSQILDYVNGSSVNFGSDLTSLAVMINGATPLKFWAPRDKLIEQRNLLGADDIPGRYYFPYRSRPINTNTFGSYQLQVVPSTVNSGAFLVAASEMTYPMGVPLPGRSV